MDLSSKKHKEDDHTLPSEEKKLSKSGRSSTKRPRKVAVLHSSDDYHYQVRKRPKMRTCDDSEASDESDSSSRMGRISGRKYCSGTPVENIVKGEIDVVTVDLETTTDDSDSPISKTKARCNDKKKHFKIKRHGIEKPVWESSSSDDGAEPFFVQKHDLFANDRVKKSDCYYPSSLQTTVREVRQLKLTDQHIEAIKHTPFWFLVRSIKDGDEDILMESTKKNEDDIRLLVSQFDRTTKAFRIGERVIQLQKQDLVLIFGVRDGNVEINAPKRFKPTPWMRRCFPDLIKEKSTEVIPQLKKTYIYNQLWMMCAKDDKIHAQDVARLLHCYLLASLFIPNGSTSISWSLCVFLEEFSDICMFDWSSLVINQLVKQMARTETLKVPGCAMLLPYWLCEHTGFIHPRKDRLFPRYLRWDLNQLHRKISMAGLDVVCEKLDIKTVLEPTSKEECTFRALNKETQEASYRFDIQTRTPNGKFFEKCIADYLPDDSSLKLEEEIPINYLSGPILARGNVMTTAAKEPTTETVVPDIIKSVPETNQTVLLEIDLAENDVVENTPLNEKTESPRGTNLFVGSSGSLELGNYCSTRSKGLVDVEGDDVLPSTERVESPKCCGHDEQLTLVLMEKELMKDENQDLKASVKQLSNDKEILLKTMTQKIDDLKAEMSQELDEVRKTLNEKEKLLIEVQCEKDILASSLTIQKEINVKQEQDLANMTQKIDDLKAEMSQELDEVRKTLNEKEKLLIEVQCEKDILASSLTIQKEINVKQEQDLANVREYLSNRTTENELLTQRVKELEAEISTLKENLKSAQTKECDQIKALEKKCDDLGAINESHRALALSIGKKFDAAKASYMEKITMMHAELEEKNNTLIEVQCARDILGSSLTTQKDINAKQEQDLTKARDDLLKKMTEMELLIQRESERNELELVISTLKKINAKQEQDLTKAMEDLLKRTTENELLTQRERERIKELESKISTLKKINARRKQNLTKVMEVLLKKMTENEFLNQRESERVNELESEISTLKENLRSAQTKECYQIKAFEKKCDDLGALTLCLVEFKDGARIMKEKFDAEKAGYMEKITMMSVELEEKSNTLREKEIRLSKVEKMTSELESKVAELTNHTHNSMDCLKLVEAHEYQNIERDKLQPYMGELGEVFISKDCRLNAEAKTRTDNAVEDVEVNCRTDLDGPTYYESNVIDKRKFEIGTSDVQHCKGKWKVTPILYSPGTGTGAVNDRTREDTRKPKHVTLHCMDRLPVSKTTDPVMEFLCRSLESPNGNCVIWSGEGQFAKVTAGDALKVLHDESLTSEIIDSWGELLIQHLSKKGKMTSTFIFTSRILEVVCRNGGSPTIQEIVDSQIRRAVESQILILPVFTLGVTGNYWTLLMYAVRSSTWTSFNLMQPGSSGMDIFKPCYSLMKYMEARMRPALIDLKENTPLTRPEEQRNNILFEQINPHPLIAGSLDCGVIVCHIMEKILKRHSISAARITEDGVYCTSTAAKYRRRMVESFCFPDDIKDMK